MRNENKQPSKDYFPQNQSILENSNQTDEPIAPFGMHIIGVDGIYFVNVLDKEGDIRIGVNKVN